MVKRVLSDFETTSPARAIVLTVIFLFPQVAWSLSTGITGHSGNPNTNGGEICTLCHSGGVAPSVQLNGPGSVEAGSLNTFTLSVSGGQQNLAGMDISVTRQHKARRRCFMQVVFWQR